VPTLTERQQRRQAQSRADRQKQDRAGRRPPMTRRVRRRLVGAGALVIVLAVVGTVVATSQSGPHAPGAAAVPTLRAHSLLKAPAASAVVQVGGHAFVTDDVNDRLLRFDMSGRATGSLHLNGRPVAVVAYGSDLWVANMVSNSVQEIAPSTLKVVRSLSVPAGPSSLVALDRRIWIASITANSVSSIDPRRGTLSAPVPLPAGAVRIAAGFGSLWVTGTTDEVTELQPSLVHPSQRSIRVGQVPIGVAVGDGSVWVANTGSGTVSRIDPGRGRVVHQYRTGGQPLALAVVQGTVWVADGTGQTVRTIFPTPASRSLDLSATPRAFLAVGSKVWIAESNPGGVVEVSRRS
jgi:DNA-binding beta-propeller fold protein YncE